MADIKVPKQAFVTPPSVGGGTGGTIRPLYGMFIDTKLNGFRGGINNSIGALGDAIKGGTLTGAQKTEANKAMKALEKALKDLGPGGTGPGPLQPPSGGWGGGKVLPMYGMFIKNALSSTQTDIGSTISDIQASIKGNNLQGQDLKDANAALKSLQTAQKDLNSVSTDW